VSDRKPAPDGPDRLRFRVSRRNQPATRFYTVRRLHDNESMGASGNEERGSDALFEWTRAR